MKFIIIDDEQINLAIAERMLTEVLGTRNTEIFDSAGDALRFLKSNNSNNTEPVTIFLDLEMPVISGLQFLELFDEFDDNIKGNTHIYLITSSVNPDKVQLALKYSNVVSYVSKPITHTFLVENFVGIKTAN